MDNLSYIDPFITNYCYCLQNITVVSTDWLHCHKIGVTVLKTSFSKAPLKDLFYTAYKQFEKDKFKYELKKELKMNQLNVIVYLKRFLWI